MGFVSFLIGRGLPPSVILQKAGIAKGRLYYDFRSKEEMLGALVVREYEDIIKACNELVEQSTCYATF